MADQHTPRTQRPADLRQGRPPPIRGSGRCRLTSG